ncbi:MAG: L,D-transpeptidase [Candidatus Zhuqueibacterota bacterium]
MIFKKAKPLYAETPPDHPSAGDEIRPDENQSGQEAPTVTSPARRNRGKIFFEAISKGLILGLILAFALLLSAPKLYEMKDAIFPLRKIASESPEIELAQLTKELKILNKKIDELARRKQFMTPREPYLIIDTSENFMTLKNRDKILHQGICSTGSYTLLKAADNTEQWIFKTPRGMLRVQNKIVDPVWRMPDWAFVEEGLPAPAPFAQERYESGVLGDYALDIGHGYLIHGTLYQRFLGLPVTHGCIRLGDKELEIVYRSLRIGSKVYIY